MTNTKTLLKSNKFIKRKANKNEIGLTSPLVVTVSQLLHA